MYTSSASLEMPPELREEARQQLNETEEARIKGLEYLKSYIQDKGIFLPRTDDEFLLRFLRNKKFRQKDACKMLKSYSDFIASNWGILSEPGTRIVEEMIQQGFVCPCPRPDASGSIASALDPSKADMRSMTGDDMMLYNYLVLEYMLQDKRFQLYGMSCFETLANFSFEQMREMDNIWTKKDKKKIFGMMSGIMPVRFSRIVVMEQPWYFSLLWAMVKLFVPKKIRKRIHLLGDDYDKLHELMGGRDNAPTFLNGTYEFNPEDFLSGFRNFVSPVVECEQKGLRPPNANLAKRKIQADKV